MIQRFLSLVLVALAWLVVLSHTALCSPIAQIFYAHANTNFGFGHGCPCTIGVVNDDGSGNQTIHTNLAGPSVFGIDIDPANEHIYWTEYDRIRRSDFDGANVVDLVTNLSDLSGLSLDLVNGNMYWVERFDPNQSPNSGQVGRAQLNGNNPQTIIAGLNRPFGIEADAQNSNQIYVGNEISTTSLFSADLNGGNIQSLGLPPNNEGPLGVTVDPSAADAQLYYTAFGPDSIQTAKFDGTNNLVVPTPAQFGGLFGIDAEPTLGKIAWVSKGGFYVAMSDLGGTNYQLVLPNMPGSPTDVAILTLEIPEPSTALLAMFAVTSLVAAARSSRRERAAPSLFRTSAQRNLQPGG